jgi:hypothetical protein
MLRDAVKVFAGGNVLISIGKYLAPRRLAAAGAPCCGGAVAAGGREEKAAGRLAVSPRANVRGITGGNVLISIGKPSATSMRRGYGASPHVAKRYSLRSAVAPSRRWPLRSRRSTLVALPSVRLPLASCCATLAMENRYPFPAFCAASCLSFQRYGWASIHTGANSAPNSEGFL